ncbi:hypothetical protein [Zooshikella harenae]|uniref:DUF1705 domain-containing protein n=1 Tax=Zooshikella harenae TaxID=2827238 RepID=A0ABS5ZIM9_9GAMM|nr:hypothetical protein [Zooshikella harenae]MBU2713936.1 hypothetical protein [Zooshikella harenae]
MLGVDLCLEDNECVSAYSLKDVINDGLVFSMILNIPFLISFICYIIFQYYSKLINNIFIKIIMFLATVTLLIAADLGIKIGVHDVFSTSLAGNSSYFEGDMYKYTSLCYMFISVPSILACLMSNIYIILPLSLREKVKVW